MLKILLCYTCLFVYQFFPGLGLLFLLKSLFKFIYIYFPLFEESFQFKFLQWLESSEYLGFNLVFLLQQVDRFLAVYMHLTYYEVNILISCFRGVNIKSEKCQIHVGSKNIICTMYVSISGCDNKKDFHCNHCIQDHGSACSWSLDLHRPRNYQHAKV